MTLQNLAKIGQLKPHKATAEEVGRRRVRRQIYVPELLVGAHHGPHRHLAGVRPGFVLPRVVADLARLSSRRSGGAGVYLLGVLTPAQIDALRRGPFAEPGSAWWANTSR